MTSEAKKPINPALKYVLTIIIILAIAVVLVSYERSKIGKHESKCDFYAEVALEYAVEHPNQFQAGNYSCFNPDDMDILNRYLNLSYNYFLCEKGMIQ